MKCPKCGEDFSVNKRNLIGSPSRDLYRQIHKERRYYSSDYDHRRCCASDVDLVELRNGKVVAFTDVKLNGKDGLTYYEKILYHELATKIAPVFLVYINKNATEFEVKSYPDDTLIGKYLSREHYFKEFIEKLGDTPNE